MDRIQFVVKIPLLFLASFTAHFAAVYAILYVCRASVDRNLTIFLFVKSYTLQDFFCLARTSHSSEFLTISSSLIHYFLCLNHHLVKSLPPNVYSMYALLNKLFTLRQKLSFMLDQLFTVSTGISFQLSINPSYRTYLCCGMSRHWLNRYHYCVYHTSNCILVITMTGLKKAGS